MAALADAPRGDPDRVTVCVCVCVCACERETETNRESTRVRERDCVCVCVCVRVFARTSMVKSTFVRTQSERSYVPFRYGMNVPFRYVRYVYNMWAKCDDCACIQKRYERTIKRYARTIVRSY